MDGEIPEEGAVDAELRRQSAEWFAESAAKNGVDLAGFDPEATLDSRLSWALRMGLLIASIYARFSSKMQDSIGDQVRAIVMYAAAHGMYVPPEFISADEAVKGRKLRRAGLDRMRSILRSGRAGVLLVYKVSRLFRLPFQGFELFQKEIVDKGLRAISTSQHIDTVEKKAWKGQLALHGLLDDMLLDAIADHCREGLVGLFRQGWTTGAVGVGYRAVEVPGAPPTKLGRPRTMPAVDEPTAELIRLHAGWLLEGMNLREGARRWRAANGPCDPRSTTGMMTDAAYRRLWANERLTGRWEFGRRRNVWSTSDDYTKQVEQPDAEVHTRACEELRILPDETFNALQVKLRARRKGPRGPRSAAGPRLHDRVIGVFRCPRCDRGYHMCGTVAMRCPGPDCPATAMVGREAAVAAVCNALCESLGRDADLIAEVEAATRRLEAGGGEDLAREAAALERRLVAKKNQVDDLLEMAGSGSESDRDELKAKAREAMAERRSLDVELANLRRAVSSRRPLSPEQLRAILGDFATVLRDGASGRLGPESIHKAADVFTRLVGGSVIVQVDPRAGRKRGAVRGVFTPRLLSAVELATGQAGLASGPAPAPIEVDLRRPPRLDAIAGEVRRLYEDEGLGFRKIAAQLGVGCGNVYASYLRYYELLGQPAPPRRPRGRYPRGGRPA